MNINHVKDEEFKKYGRILENIKVEGILKVMEKIPIPESTVYAASVSELEDVVEEMEQLRIKGYGGLPIQIGYCNGNNHKLNAVEYHRCSEINIASTDLILILGCLQDVSEEGSYNTAHMEAFLIPQGMVVEIYGTTLHYAPCNAQTDGFRCVVVLPKGTNGALDFEPVREGENARLRSTNKWSIAHPDSGKVGYFIGLTGENITID